MADYSKIQVLIVDDEVSIRDSIACFLDDYGFATHTCASTEEARDALRDNQFHVCILDLRLPGLNGEDLVLLANERYPEMRYIIHTGSISYTLSDELLAAGIRPEHVFHKPIRVLSLLVKCIKALVPEAESGESPS